MFELAYDREEFRICDILGYLGGRMSGRMVWMSALLEVFANMCKSLFCIVWIILMSWDI